MATVSMGFGTPVDASVLLSARTAFRTNLYMARCPMTSVSITTSVAIRVVFDRTI